MGVRCKVNRLRLFVVCELKRRRHLILTPFAPEAPSIWALYLSLMRVNSLCTAAWMSLFSTRAQASGRLRMNLALSIV